MGASLEESFPDTLVAGKAPKKSLLLTFGHLLLNHIMNDPADGIDRGRGYGLVQAFFLDAVQLSNRLVLKSKSQKESSPWSAKTTAPNSDLRALLEKHIDPLVKCSLPDLFQFASFSDNKPVASPVRPVSPALSPDENTAARTPGPKSSRKAEDELNEAVKELPQLDPDSKAKAKDRDVQLAAFSLIAVRAARLVTDFMIETGVDAKLAESPPYMRAAAALGSVFGGTLLKGDRFAPMVSVNLGMCSLTKSVADQVGNSF